MVAGQGAVDHVGGGGRVQGRLGGVRAEDGVKGELGKKRGGEGKAGARVP
jgi:hypothetical protein